MDADNGKVLLSHDQKIDPSFALDNSAAFSNDGKVVASALGEKAVELWNAASGKTMASFEVPEQKQEMLSPAGKRYSVDLGVCPIMGAFSADGGLLAVEAGNQLLLFDVTKRKPPLSLPWQGGDGGPLPAKSPAVLTVGRWMAATACFSSTILLWDLKTGKQLRQLERQEGTVAALSMSSDERLIASCTGFWGANVSSIKGYDYGDHTVQLWDVASGRRLLNIKGHTKNVRSVVCVPDCRCLLSGAEDKTIRLWEVSTGKQLFRWDMGEMVNQVAISPDGRKMAAALADGSVTMFPLDSPRSDKPRSPVDAKAFEDLWTDLAAEDAEQAYRAVRDLTQISEDIPALLAKRLRPARSLALLIADLNSDDFNVREAASREVAALSAQAEPALRKALAETDSLEVRNRITRSVKPLGEWVVTDPNTLRALRAVWVLERIATPEARAVLEDLAKGALEARQTQEAKSALDFLDKRAAVKP